MRFCLTGQLPNYIFVRLGGGNLLSDLAIFQNYTLPFWNKEDKMEEKVYEPKAFALNIPHHYFAYSLHGNQVKRKKKRKRKKEREEKSQSKFFCFFRKTLVVEM